MTSEEIADAPECACKRAKLINRLMLKLKAQKKLIKELKERLGEH